MSRATEVYAREFDAALLNLPSHIRSQVEAKIEDLGLRLAAYPHHRLQGRSEFRLRVGDYRIIYDVDQQQNVLYLLTLGHRREIYR